MKAKLDKMLEVKNQAVGLYESMEVNKMRFTEREREYEDCLTKMGIELEAKLALELRLMDDNEVLKMPEKKACQRVATAKKKAEEERAWAEEERTRADDVVKRAEEATKRAEEAKAKAIIVVDLWRTSPKFDALAQDTYMVALEEIVKHIDKERPNIDTVFLVKVLDKHKEEL